MAINTRRAAERAHHVFKAEGWTWGASTTPTLDDIEETIERLVKDIEAKEVPPGDFSYIATGHLRVTRYAYEDGETETFVAVTIGDDFDDYNDLEGS